MQNSTTGTLKAILTPFTTVQITNACGVAGAVGFGGQT